MSSKLIDRLRAFWSRVVTPAPVVVNITIDKEAMAIARPGDLVVISLQQILTGKARESFRAVLKHAREGQPGVQFLVVEGAGGRSWVFSGVSDK